MQVMSHIELLDAGCLHRWIPLASLGSSKYAVCIKNELPGPRRDLGVSTQTEETEGALSTSDSPQKTRQHPRESQNTGTKKMQSAVVAALHWKVPRRRRTTQGAVCVTGWSAGDMGYAVHEGFLEEVHRSPRSCRRCGAQGYCRSMGRQALTSTKFGQLDLWTVWVTSVHHLCSTEHARRQERSPRVPVIVAEGCLQKQVSDSVTPREIPLVLLVQGKDKQSSKRAHLGNCCKCWLELKLQVTGVVLNTLLQLQRFLEHSAVDPMVRSGSRGVLEESCKPNLRKHPGERP
ncbi:hypothetical protein NDU88_008595 [Pleurodeles waltl]|uniref:Uncharacterized protein n=1 Tax=Pleurodeles waltl TaxID=8319 RepID=A0AAV7QQ55_PLEWA|nr:hypothetical protein NDU88_008595 [Pleurodeles waltl]